MSRVLRVCLFNREVQLSMHQPFQSFSDLRIVGQVSSTEEMLDWVCRLSVDIAVVNLDSAGALEVTEQVRRMAPHCGILGISKSSEAKDIIRAMRAGCNQYVRWPVEKEDLREALDQITALTAPRASGSRRICVMGASGGAGSTTVACNLAIELGNLGLGDCGLVDLNLELGDVGCLFDVQPLYSIADVCKDGMDIDRSVLEKAFHKLACNVSVLTRPQKLEEVYEVTPDGVAQMLDEARSMFPFLVADLPRTFDPPTAAALCNTDHILIVTQLSVAAIRNATRISESLRKMGIPENNIGVVLNLGGTGVGHLTPEDMESHFGKPVFATVPNDYQRVQASLDIGYSTVKEDSRNPVQAAIREMAHKIAGDMLQRQELDNPEASPLLKRFWRRKPEKAAAGV